MFRSLAFLSALLLPLGAAAQFVERIDVSIANVEVVVTDRKGTPVRGLTKDDFELFENGKPQTITNFFAAAGVAGGGQRAAGGEGATVGATAPAAEVAQTPQQRPRLIVLFIDIDEIDVAARKRFFEALGGYLDEAMRPGDFLTIATWANRVRILAQPTSDRDAVKKGIAVLAETSRWSEQETMRRLAETIALEAERDAQFAASLGRAGPDPEAERAFQEWVSSEERCQRIKRKAKEIRTLILHMARVDLQKVLLFASDDVSLRPNTTCSTMHELDALANTANAYGITIHAFHPPGARDRFVRGPEQGGFIPPAQTPMAREYERVFDQSGGLLHLAARTGGHVAVGPGQAEETLARAVEELDAYYSLGYRLSPGSEDKPRKIKVVTKNKSYRVRTRDSVVRLSEPARIRDRVVTNLYLPEQASSTTPAFAPRVTAFRREDRFVLADVALTIAVKSLVTLSERGSFSIFAAAGRELGDASDVVELKQDFDVKSLPAGAEVITYSFTIRLRPDSRRLSVAVRDNVSGEVATKLLNLSRK